MQKIGEGKEDDASGADSEKNEDNDTHHVEQEGNPDGELEDVEADSSHLSTEEREEEKLKSKRISIGAPSHDVNPNPCYSA